jgi:hypothetical protein
MESLWIIQNILLQAELCRIPKPTRSGFINSDFSYIVGVDNSARMERIELARKVARSDKALKVYRACNRIKNTLRHSQVQTQMADSTHGERAREDKTGCHAPFLQGLADLSDRSSFFNNAEQHPEISEVTGAFVDNFSIR